jgi:hypothetical protein
LSIPISWNRKNNLENECSSLVERAFQPIAKALNFARRIAHQSGTKMMSEKSKPSQKPISESVGPVEEGLRLTSVFRKIQDRRDRKKVIALAERLLDEQNAD